MAGVSSARNAEISSQLPESERELPSFTLFDSPFPEPPVKRFASLSESELEELVGERHSKKTKETTNWSVSTFKGKKQLLEINWHFLTGFNYAKKGEIRCRSLFYCVKFM